MTFLNDLSSFFGIQNVLFCLALDSDEQMARGWSAAADMLKVHSYFGITSADRNNSIGTSQLKETERLLVFSGSDDSTCQESFVPVLGLHSNIVWLSIQKSLSVHFPGNLRLDSHWYTVQVPKGQSYIILEHYRIKQGPVITARLGKWTKTGGLDIPVPSVWERRSDLKGTVLTNTILPYPPLSIVMDSGNVQDGFLAQIFLTLSARLNFTFTTTSPPDGEWGLLRRDQGNGSFWSGMVGQLARKEVDICTAGLSNRQGRQLAIDFTVAITDEVITLIMPKSPSNRQIDMMTYLVALRPSSWVILCVMCLCLSLVYNMVSNVPRVKNVHSLAVVQGLFSGLVLVFRSFLQLGGEMPDRLTSWSFKIFCITTWMLCFCTFQLYAGNMTASMTASGSSASPKSFQDVLQAGFSVHTSRGGATEAKFIRATRDSPPGQIYRTRLVLHDSDGLYAPRVAGLVTGSGSGVIFDAVNPFLSRGDLRVVMDFQV